MVPIGIYPYCKPFTGGHEPDCPLHPDNMKLDRGTAWTFKPNNVGWKCPVCKKGNAPWTGKCVHCADRARLVRTGSDKTTEGDNE